MIIRRPADIASSEITPESVYLQRRQFMQGLGAGAAIASLGLPLHSLAASSTELTKLNYRSVVSTSGNPFYTDEKMAGFSDASSHNNFYEFGTDKSDPARYADSLTVDPWSIEIEGEVAKPGKYPLEDIMKLMDLEERIYRLRCVEAWSMVIPWVGFGLGDMLKMFEPSSKAKYVEFTTVYRPDEMRGQRSRFSTIEWPYREGLRMDEAMNPLAFMSVGMYGKTLPNQNGAPIRLVVPWKYGFKSIKSIVKIRFTERQPRTSWEGIAPSEYGFYANVNPDVDHPRWSQGYERRLPSSLLSPGRIKTQMFNGYGDQVAHLYKDMNLRRYY